MATTVAVATATASPRSCIDDSGSSPRSTVLIQGSSMTTNVSVMNESSVGPETVAVEENKGQTRKEPPKESAANPASPRDGENKASGENKPAITQEQRKGVESRYSPHSQFPAGVNPASQLTPQPQGGYYLGYTQSQVTPAPPSPAPPGATVAYDAASFFQQPGAFAPPNSTAFGGQNTPLSPPRAIATTATAMGVSIPPASPLFPRISSGGGLAVPTAGLGAAAGQRGPAAPQSPNLPYMSPHLGSVMYQQYPVTSGVGSQSSDSPDDGNAWNDGSLPPQSQLQSAYQQSSPQMQSMAMAYASMANVQTRAGRTYSFEETMLPPSVLDQQEQSNPQYSPYSTSQSSPGPAGATLFAHQSWTYGGPPDMYSTPGSPLQPRPSAHPPMGMYAGAGAPPMDAGMRQMGGQMGAPYGQYYPASSPGPPIQTTASNKGPDGANLFIFHIPNHFTNLDMYQLFCPYGNLLSVRIMVEKDTGRSRGFGFVSYDSPESAALAIKELNGFAIGNKRLKVQHKQIRPKDLRNERDNSHGGFGDGDAGDDDGSGVGYQRPQFSSSLPPSGPMASQNMWYDNSRPTPQSAGADGSPEAAAKPADEGTEITSTSTGAETPLQLGLKESPLSSLGTLQNALPDVPGNGGTPE